MSSRQRKSIFSVLWSDSKPKRTYTPRKIRIKSPMELMAKVSLDVGACFSQAFAEVQKKYNYGKTSAQENGDTHPRTEHN